MMRVVQTLSEETDIQTSCAALSVPRASFYRWKDQSDKPTRTYNPPLKLQATERQNVLDILHSTRFVDYSPGEIVPILLDEGQYICSERTMYRILAQENELKERRQRVRGAHQYQKPELLATGPNQVYSWDITKLKGPQKWNYFYLYVILDIYSRYVVGWMVADRESAVLADRLISEVCRKQKIKPGQLTIHADRGASMTSKLVANLMSYLGITKTHSRPYTSDDNPFSESQFKTLKYCPQFPERFGCIEDTQTFCRAFFRWYNNEHRHSGIVRLTPQMLHYGHAEGVLKGRNKVLLEASNQHPGRFKHKVPTAGEVPVAVWINPPKFQDQVAC